MTITSQGDSTERKLTWLHVSDAHLKAGDPYESDLVLRALVSAVERRRENRNRVPDLILFTGDVAQSGKEAEYARAGLFFDALLAAAGLDKGRLFVIPGNHDVDRDAGQGLARTLTDEEDSVSFFRPSAPKYHFGKLAAYRTWHDAYFATQIAEGTRSAAPSDTTCQHAGTVEVNGVRVVVLVVNTALFCQGDDDIGKLWVGRRPLNEALKTFPFDKGDLRLALMHHPFDWLHEGEKIHIRTALHDHFDVILRGHLHENDIAAVSTGGRDAGTLHLAAGASYQTRRWPNRALLVTVEYDAGKLRILPLRYEDSPREKWLVDPSLYSEEENFEGELSVRWKAPTASQSTPPQPSPVAGGAAVPQAVPPSAAQPAPTAAPVSAPRPLRKLTQDETDRLVDAFLGTDTMSDQQRRNEVVKSLPSGWLSRTHRSTIALTDVDAIVTTALRYEGGLQALLGRVRRTEGDSRERRELDKVIRQLFPDREL